MGAPKSHEAFAFLALPLEIRTQIYIHALKRGSIYFHSVQKAIQGRSSCVCPYSVHSWLDFKLSQDEIWKDKHQLCRCMSRRSLGYCPDRLCIEILYTCRQVHAEASEVLWSKNTFDFGGKFSFLQIIPKIGLLNRAALRSLSLTIGSIGWPNRYVLRQPKDHHLAARDPFWDMNALLKDLRGLQVLYIEIEVKKLTSFDYEPAFNMCDTLTKIPLKAVEVILFEDRFKGRKEDRPVHLQRVEDRLIEGFTPKLDQPSYRPPVLKVMWKPEL